MEYFTYRPQTPLSKYVNTLWLGKSSDIAIQETNRPPLYSELIFNFGDRFSIEGDNIIRMNGCIISGLKTKPFTTKVDGLYLSFGLIMKPFCYRFLENSMNSKLVEKLTAQIYNAINKNSSPEFHKIESNLLSIFEAAIPKKTVLSFVKEINADFLRKATLKNYCKSLPVTQKHFINQFKRYYAITPAQFIKLSQIDQAIYAMKCLPEKSLSEIALETGFYDQSHFIRIFKNYCGIPPTVFLEERISKNPKG